MIWTKKAETQRFLGPEITDLPQSLSSLDSTRKQLISQYMLHLVTTRSRAIPLLHHIFDIYAINLYIDVGLEPLDPNRDRELNKGV
ncbi:MAG: hypothetical protein ABFC38_00470 [Methanospirillum sp.]